MRLKDIKMRNLKQTVAGLQKKNVNWKAEKLSFLFWINFGYEKWKEDWDVDGSFPWRFQKVWQFGGEVEPKCGGVARASIGGSAPPSLTLYQKNEHLFIKAGKKHVNFC